MVEPREEQFRGLVEAFGPSLQRVARVYEFDHGLQEDLVQEMLVALWRGLARFRGDSNLRTWVYRVAHNVALKHQRGWGRRRRRQNDYRRYDHESDAKAENDPAKTAENRATVERLLMRVAELSMMDRQLICLYLEGLTGVEIAEVSGLSQTNVSTRLHRLRTKLANELEPKETGDAAS